ncbi:MULTISPECIES: PDR/VanB family oxidoreductase [unclassified Beijerinckia]|uniref:PDR/VanB family oxidoreductase n=1 Tax=unclassified Beijerinckia TaxID=2638183 RepID=UPI00147C49C5|nr:MULTISPECIES: PDR/VanB family oxidoreductase [unclassified Beijerinckia]
MIEVVVQTVTRPVAGVRRFVLAAADGGLLPAFAPGDHIEVETPCGIVRPYSLCGDPARRDVYEIAVLREGQGRGGSRSMHDALAKGRGLRISEPRGLFPLRPGAAFTRLVAGGIGATPLVAMAHHLARERLAFDFHYCARDRDGLVFLPELQRLVPPEALHVHLSGGDEARRFDPRRHPLTDAARSAVYCCGPDRLMSAVRQAYRDVCPVHTESFKPSMPDDAMAFEVVLARTQRTVPVKADESILVALWRAGIERPLSCETGICGTCRTPWCGGEPEHRDALLTEDERKREMLICVSRCRLKTLVLDI